MKKILIITLEYPPQVGGIASYVQNVALHMPAEQVVVYGPRMLDDKLHDEKNPWKTYRYKPYWFLWPRWLRMFFHIRHIVKKEHITELHIHHALPVGYVGLLIKRLYHVPYRLFLHGSDFQLAIEHKRKVFFRVCSGASEIIVNSAFVEQKVHAAFEKLSVMKVVSPSPHDYFLKATISESVLNKLRAELALNGKKVILTVARLVDRKGHVLLARILPKIVQEIPNAVWVIIGDGPEQEKILHIIQSNNLQNSVRFLSRFSPEKLALYYRLGELFVLLTHKDQDGVDEAWGTVFLEAAASGLPVVAGRSGGVEEAVEHLVTGIVVDTHQEQAVVQSIVELLKNGDYAKQMGEAGRRRVEREFTWDKQLKKLNFFL